MIIIYADALGPTGRSILGDWALLSLEARDVVKVSLIRHALN